MLLCESARRADALERQAGAGPSSAGSGLGAMLPVRKNLHLHVNLQQTLSSRFSRRPGLTGKLIITDKAGVRRVLKSRIDKLGLAMFRLLQHDAISCGISPFCRYAIKSDATRLAVVDDAHACHSSGG